MEKFCRNCKHFTNAGGGTSFCTHTDHAGTIVPPFTTCGQFDAKKPRAPFDNIKLISKDYGEMVIHYICEKCGKEMKEPAKWQIRLPLGKSLDGPVYRYYCEDCMN